MLKIFWVPNPLPHKRIPKTDSDKQAIIKIDYIYLRYSPDKDYAILDPI